MNSGYINNNFIIKTDDDYIGMIHNNFEYKKNIAMFDLDNTLITTKSNKKFPQDENDWKFLNNNVVNKIKILSLTHSIIIITNQKKVNGDKAINNFIKKMDDIVKSLCPICVFVLNGDGIYRKPQPFIFNEIKLLFEVSGKVINMNNDIFYCGDAAGRNTDHGDCDLKFAKNLNISFYVPEQMFGLAKDEAIGRLIIDPIDDNSNKPKIQYNLTITYPTLIKNKQMTEYKYVKTENKEMILMVGFPGSGKTTIAKKLQADHNFYVVSKDVNKTKDLKVCQDYANRSYNIVIDNTNLKVGDREKYIQIGKQYKYYIRVIFLKTPIDICKHNNCYRSSRNTNISKVPEIVYRTMQKNCVIPNLNEHIDEIEEIDFQINATDDAYYYYYY